MTGYILFSVFVALIILALLLNKKQAREIKAEGYHTMGEVTGYENKFMQVAGTWTWLDYPTVSYTDGHGRTKTGFIKKASSSGRYYQVGAKVKIVVHNGTIYALDTL